jgi:acetolactate synthase-1/2/3 large subunit
VRTARTAEGLADDGVDAVCAALAPRPDPAGGIATLIVPADCAWGPGRAAAAVAPPARVRPFSAAAVAEAAAALDDRSVLLLDGNALTEAGLAAAGRLAARFGCRVFTTTFPARVESGPGRFAADRLPYFPEQIIETLAGTSTLLLAGAQPPVSFFAYQNLPSDLVPADCRVVRLSHRHEDGAGALAALADAVGAAAWQPPSGGGMRPELPAGRLSARTVAQTLAALAPDNCIVTSDSGGGGAAVVPMQRAVPHDWLHLTGGAIGQAGPASVGAALACPDRQVLALIGDGGALYTHQYLWTAAREGLDIVTVIYSNRSYGILDTEYRRLGINEVGERAASLFDLGRPDIDWVSLAAGFGVPGARANSCESFAAALREALARPGPSLIEAQV